jgi:hypothetical protein
MAKKSKKSSKSDRSDPKKNKSLATRLVMKKMPGAKASAVVGRVKSEYGHTINPYAVDNDSCGPTRRWHVKPDEVAEGNANLAVVTRLAFTPNLSVSVKIVLPQLPVGPEV